MAGLVTLADFEDRYGRAMVDAGEIVRVEALITDASALVVDAAALATAWTAATVPATVVPVLCEVVRRALDNPAGLLGETIGDYSWRGGKVASGVFLTAGERRIVHRAAGTLSAGMADLSGYLPTGPIDPRYYGSLSTDGVTIINTPEPEEL